MRRRRYGDAGQAFPIYITVVAGLLFLAFAYLAVGQAAATRNEAQTAADASALAAALDARDQLAGDWLENVQDPDQWQDIFEGAVPVEDPCWRADQLAAQNDAHVDSCVPDGPLGYTVEVTTDEPVGDTIIPETEAIYAEASAKAVIEPRCTFEPLGEDAGDEELPTLTCEDENWELSPDDLTDLPDPEDLFDVHLAD
ncbi:flp pilus-assembly TadE/G-like family protein [Streptomyces sp. NPDC052687]|uniref:flp pilus-assembly TadE/G-like family protein n=1 Tax=Streptomyces sp. NPDC052687 TaxID=3154759 RepID=UPI00343D48AB